jgi:hypothetical protein
MAAGAIAAELVLEASRFDIDVGDIVFEYDDVLIFDSFIRAHAAEFG